MKLSCGVPSRKVASVAWKQLKVLSLASREVYSLVGMPHDALLSEHKFVSLAARQNCHSVSLFKIIINIIDCPNLLEEFQIADIFYFDVRYTNLYKSATVLYVSYI